MIDILLVEDEQIEREAITSLLATKFASRFSLLTAANNGKQGLEEFKSHPVQLVITDINTPKMSGLEMLKEIKKISPEVRAIVLTGYDYFQYAQEAIRIGVDDFILKPASQKDLYERIEKVIEMIQLNGAKGTEISIDSRFEEIQSILQSDLIYAILYNDSEQHIEKYFLAFHMDVQNAICFCMYRKDIAVDKLHQIVDTLNKSNKSKMLCAFEMYFDYIVVFAFKDSPMEYTEVASIYQNLRHSQNDSLRIGVGGVKSHLNDFYLSFSESMEKLLNDENYCELIQQQQVLENFYSQKISEYTDEIIVGMENNCETAIAETADKLYNYIMVMEKTDRREALHEFLINLINRVEEYEQWDAYHDVLKELLQQLDFFDNTHDIRIYISYFVKSIVDPFLYTKRKKSNKLIIKSFEFIKKNYHRAIGLNDLADYLEVTPQYISTLLSQHTHNNFTNILAEYRIEKAKALLDSNRKIKEIAALVGFQNQNYFAKTFKKVTGITPKEYKSTE